MNKRHLTQHKQAKLPHSFSNVKLGLSRGVRVYGILGSGIWDLGSHLSPSPFSSALPHPTISLPVLLYCVKQLLFIKVAAPPGPPSRFVSLIRRTFPIACYRYTLLLSVPHYLAQTRGLRWDLFVIDPLPRFLAELDPELCTAPGRPDVPCCSARFAEICQESTLLPSGDLRMITDKNP